MAFLKEAEAAIAERDAIKAENRELFYKCNQLAEANESLNRKNKRLREQLDATQRTLRRMGDIVKGMGRKALKLAVAVDTAARNPGADVELDDV